MTQEVSLNIPNANEAMEIVRELRSKGAVQGTDFDFSYIPTKWDEITGHLVHDKSVVFRFYTEIWASWAILKYDRG